MPQMLAELKTYTMEDIYALPEGERAELIDGQMYFMTSPNTSHQRISSKLHQLIANYIDSKHGEYEVFAAPFAVFLNAYKDNYVEPDLSIICDKHKIEKDGCHGAPDWIIEIVSPSSRRMDYYIKLFSYRTEGVREYWIVDAERNLVTTYDFQNNNAANYTFSDCIPVGIYPEFVLDFTLVYK